MACCTGRYFLLTTCVLQLISLTERQVLDFLGFMWTPIIANFIEIIVTILGVFGAYQHKTRYIAVYGVLTSFWLAWNIFVICFYLEAGALSRDSNVLNMGTGSRSWWLINGAGCAPTYNMSKEDPFLFPTPTSVEGCVVKYYFIESIHAGIQCFLAVLGIAGSCWAFYTLSRNDDSCAVKSVSRSFPYSIEYQNNEPSVPDPNSNCQRPMTPRKVKQRSTRSKRSSRRRYYQNPVTKLINVSGQNSCSSLGLYPGQTNPMYRSGTPSEAGSRPTPVLFLNGRPSPIYMNESDTVI